MSLEGWGVKNGSSGRFFLFGLLGRVPRSRGGGGLGVVFFCYDNRDCGSGKREFDDF